ncbi:MAG TPA: response regulator [Bacteroidota bacterium]|nr:response regulator [Bacteroidota bacterium]
MSGALWILILFESYRLTEQKTILFLEDEEELLSTMGMLLREQGYNVVLSNKAEEALKIARNSTLHLILADIKLPGMDGLDFFREVRKLDHLQKIPFVFLTAFNNLKTAMDAKKDGAAEYITKPFDFEYLVTRIRELLPV